MFTEAERQDNRTLSPVEATRQLGEMQRRYDERQRTEAAERTAGAERDALSRRQRDRLSPDAAAKKLAERLADPDWRDRYLGGNVEARREATALIEDKAAGNLVDSIMDGSALANARATGLGSTTRGGELPISAQMATVQDLREIGISDDSIRHVLEGKEVTQAEHDAAKLAKARRMSDGEWSRKLLAGDLDAKREMMLWSIILSSSIKGAV